MIIEDEGGDALIESKRDKLFRALPEEAEDLEDDENVSPGNESSITADEIAKRWSI